MTDPVCDMLIRLQNAEKAGKPTVQVYYSKFKHEIIKALERAGFVKGVERKGKRVRRILEIELGEKSGQRPIAGLRLLSKPSRRLYAPVDELFKVSKYGGTVIVSTSKGVMSAEEAKKAKVGGQLIVEVW